ncbi:DMT family transporter [Candidatus Poseidoniales archaeon]|nr:DMT family transporter [Candidatus Poseidoniales archaeon]
MQAVTRRKAVWGLLVVTIVWGATFIWMKQAMNAVQTEIDEYGQTGVVSVLVGGRFLIAAIALFIGSSKARAALRERELWAGGTVLGLILLVGFTTQMVGIDTISPSTSAFLTSLYVVFTAMISTKMTGQRVTRMMIVGVLLATFGAGFIEGPPHLSWGKGEILTVICAFFFALHIIFTQSITQRMDPLGVTITSFVIVSIGSFLISVLMGGMDTFKLWELPLQQDVIVPLLCLGLLGSLFALLLLNLLQRYLHPVQAAIIYGLEPVWATMFALGLGLSDWSGWIAIGGSALLLGNVLVELRQSTRAEEE